MLYVTNSLFKDNEGPEWHVGKPFDMISGREAKIAMELVNATVSVYADGDERHYIDMHFTGIRGCVGNRGVLWVGDEAKFIVANLR